MISKHITVQLDQPDLGMPSPDYYLKDDVAFLKVYEKYARDVAIMFGADKATASQQIHDTVQLEMQLANVSLLVLLLLLMVVVVVVGEVVVVVVVVAVLGAWPSCSAPTRSRPPSRSTTPCNWRCIWPM